MIEFSETTFIIDLISSTYKTKNPREIIKACKSDMDLSVTLIEVLNFLSLDEENVKPAMAYSINFKDL